MSRIWITADHHFGHGNIIAHCKRPFADVYEMEEALIQRWNWAVGPKDQVYHLGDFVYRTDPRPYLRRLHGRVHLIRGDHDRTTSAFVDVRDVLLLRLEGHKAWLSHYPHLSWPGSDKGTIHLHGHSHGKGAKRAGVVDVGVDCWEFAPVALDRLWKEAENEEA